MLENSDLTHGKTGFSASVNSIIRLLHYKNAVHRLKKLGLVKVFSDNLGDATNVVATQVRKDFSVFGITGNKKGGYFVDDLLAQLNRILGKEAVQKVIIVGAGKIGAALMEYRGFVEEGFTVVAAFDTNPSKLDASATVPILALEDLNGFVRENGIKLGIVAVPADSAQQAFDIMVDAGIKGILNFAPVQLKAAPDVTVSNVNIAMELEKLWYYTRIS